jgi:rhodanese-related sulfurtransferase
MKKLLIISIFMLLLVGCSTKEQGAYLTNGKINCTDIETIKTYNDYMIIDVRTPDEYNSGHLEKAINIEYQDIVSVLEEKNISKETPIVVYCKSGGRSGQAYESLKQAGFTHIYDLGAMSSCNK